MKILHVLDHSLPLHSGYTFRTAAILTEQRRRGWETVHLTSPKQGASEALTEQAGGFEFHRTPYSPGWLSRVPMGWPLDEMRALGIHVSLDDFGTGHSSLAQLSRFPIQGLKIDRTLVAAQPADGHHRDVAQG